MFVNNKLVLRNTIDKNATTLSFVKSRKFQREKEDTTISKYHSCISYDFRELNYNNINVLSKLYLYNNLKFYVIAYHKAKKKRTNFVDVLSTSLQSN